MSDLPFDSQWTSRDWNKENNWGNAKKGSIVTRKIIDVNIFG